MNGIYWGLTALALMDRTTALPRQEMIEWVMRCWDDKLGENLRRVTMSEGRRTDSMSVIIGAFSPHPGHDVSLHSTLSAIQILAIQDSMAILNVDKLVSCKFPLQRSSILD